MPGPENIVLTKQQVLDDRHESLVERSPDFGFTVMLGYLGEDLVRGQHVAGQLDRSSRTEKVV